MGIVVPRLIVHKATALTVAHHLTLLPALTDFHFAISDSLGSEKQNGPPTGFSNSSFMSDLWFFFSPSLVALGSLKTAENWTSAPNPICLCLSVSSEGATGPFESAVISSREPLVTTIP